MSSKEKKLWQAENFLQQVKEGPYYICTICHGSLYQCSVRFFKHEKYWILISELYHPVKSFDEKLYIVKTCHKYLYKNEIPCQSVCHKMALDPLPDEIKDFKKNRKKS